VALHDERKTRKKTSKSHKALIKANRAYAANKEAATAAQFALVDYLADH
jgi:hypothetical protein